MGLLKIQINNAHHALRAMYVWKKYASSRLWIWLSVVVMCCVLCVGCAKKDTNEFNRPAMYWYQKIMKEIKFGNLENADNFYASLQSEHSNSPLLPQAMLILAQAHVHNEEYVLAEFYFDEYAKRFSTAQNADYIAYLKLRARYYGIKHSSKDQEFFSESLAAFDAFKEKFPTSRYLPFVQTMQVRFVLGQNELNKGIVNVYNKQNKPQAAQQYTERIDGDLAEHTKPKPSYIPIYVRMFNW